MSSDDKEGKDQLDNFIDPKRSHPVIATTSKLLSTGVDAQTCHVIVLDQSIQSLSEFKQIIGRGTRLRTDYDKYFFTILDFRKATELFADPDWDGEPVSVYDPAATPPDGDPLPNGDEDSDDKVVYTVSNVTFEIVGERVQYYGNDGTLITETLRDYSRKEFQKEFRSLDDFVQRWNEADQKNAIIGELGDLGVLLEALEEPVGRNLDPFDLICHVAFDQPPLTRRERADGVKKKDVFTKYGDTARTVLEALLDKYADQGINTLENIEILKLDPFTEIGTTVQIVNSFGGRDQYDAALKELTNELYSLNA